MINDNSLPHGGTVQSQREIERVGGRELVELWLGELKLASDEERDWRQQARKALARYRDENVKNKKPGDRNDPSRFNILWANTEIMKPSLYSQTPQPDVRRRYRDPDPAGRFASMLLERALSYTLDEYDFDHVMDLAVNDLLLPGRAVTRVRYNAVIGGEGESEEKKYENVQCERWPWDRWRRGPGGCWEEVSWIAYEHLMTKDEQEDAFGKELSDRLTLDVEVQNPRATDNEKDDSRVQPDVYKRGRVWEIWDKDNRRVLWIAPSLPDEPVKIEEDKLRLEGFFDVPRPMYAVETSDSLVPIEEYRLYRDQAEELDRVTQRIAKLVEGLKVRGIYDAVLRELNALMRGDDNTLVPSEAATSELKLRQGRGSLEDYIWFMPIEPIARALVGLYEQREQIKQVIYEVVGLSDIMRGASDPNETLGAQQIKAQSGSIRLQRRIREVQRYARDLIRMKAEIMAEHFSPVTLAVMTGLPLHHVAQVQPMLAEDGPRGFRIDIETDSTIAAETAADQQNMSNMLTAIGGFVDAVGPAVQLGYFPQDGAKTILMAAIRKMKLGRQVEDALEQLEAQAQPAALAAPAAQGQVDPAAQAAQADAAASAQMETAKLQADVEGKAADRQLAMQKEQVSAQVKARELSLKEAEAQLKAAEFEHRKEMDRIKTRMDVAAFADGITSREEDREANQVDQRQGKLDEVDAEMEKLAEAMQQLAEAMVQLSTVQAQNLQQQADHNERLLAAMTAPRELVRDEQGRPSGVRPVMN